MNNLNLVQTAREILAINEDFLNHLNNPYIHSLADYQMENFVQNWGNTSGGFESIGGDSMTSQRTYVFIPFVDKEDCHVYFAGIYAYSVPMSDKFMEDVKNHNIKGLKHKNYYD